MCDDGAQCTYDNCVGGACQHPALTGDCTDDGVLDLLIVAETGNTFRMWTGKGDGTFHPFVAITGESSSPHHAVPVDINRDGKLDFVAGHATGTMSV